MTTCIENPPPGDTKEWKCVHGHALVAVVSLVIWDRHQLAAWRVASVAKEKAFNSPVDWFANPRWLFNNDPLWRSPPLARGSESLHPGETPP